MNNNKTKQFVSFIQTVSNLNEIPHKYALRTYFYQWGQFVMLIIRNLNLISIQSWTYLSFFYICFTPALICSPCLWNVHRVVLNGSKTHTAEKLVPWQDQHQTQGLTMEQNIVTQYHHLKTLNVLLFYVSTGNQVFCVFCHKFDYPWCHPDYILNFKYYTLK